LKQRRHDCRRGTPEARATKRIFIGELEALGDIKAMDAG
jgi:hypothetical protein